MDLKKYIYTRGENAGADKEFEQGNIYGKVKLGSSHIFWKKGFWWYKVDMARVERVYRRVEEVRARVCCGPANFDIQKLVLLLKDGESLTLLIGEGNVREAECLYQELKEKHPELQYGKVD